MADYVAEQKIGYPVCIDVKNATTTAFAVDSYLIDRAGKLRVADLQNAAVDRAVETLLAEKPATESKPSDAESRDAQQRLGAALAEAKRSERKVLVHVHGPG